MDLRPIHTEQKWMQMQKRSKKSENKNNNEANAHKS